MARKKRYGSERNFHTSYMGFSKKYASSTSQNLQFTRRKNRQSILELVILALAVLVMLAVGFFVTDVLLKLSEKPPEAETTVQGETNGTSATEVPTTTAPPRDAKLGNIAGLYCSPASFRSDSALNSLAAKAKRENRSTVLLELKDREGRLAFPSGNETAQVIGAAANALVDCKERVAQLKQQGLQVFGRIYCFQDPLAAGARRDMAVHYGTGDSLWLDNKSSAGGKPWLNPFSEAAQEYLLDLVRECAALGVDALVLDALQFGQGGLSKAGFPGEDTAERSRNAALNTFVEKVKQAAGGVPVICYMESAAARGQVSEQYDGDLWSCKADAFLVPLKPAEFAGIAQFPKGKKAIVFSTQQPGSGDYILY